MWLTGAQSERGGAAVVGHSQREGDEADALWLDPASRILTRGGASQQLTPALTSVMLLLIRAAPGSVSSEAIWRTVRGEVPPRQTSAVRTLVYALRKACRETLGDDLVETVWGTGYRLRDGYAIAALTNVSEN